MRDKYTAKAVELKEKAYGDNRNQIIEAAESYTRMAASVEHIITVMSEV